MSVVELVRLQPSLAARYIGRAAVRALHAELVLYPKPGLVSPVDPGAHDDMDASTFMRSLSALRHYFVTIAEAGEQGASFHVLQSLGIEAERRMLSATGGVNTHRGAIFSLGLLTAAAGWRHRRGRAIGASALAETVVSVWGSGIAEAGQKAQQSNGGRAVRLYNVRGAREEALEGFPTLTNIALPTLGAILSRVGCPERAQVQTLFAIMAELDDTNLLHRGGAAGLAFIKDEARCFLNEGGVLTAGWRAHALALHRGCIARHLSPGGSADILAAAWFVHSLQM